METWAPIAGMTMVSIGAATFVVGLVGLAYSLGFRPQRSGKANAAPSGGAGQGRTGEGQHR